MATGFQKGFLYRTGFTEAELLSLRESAKADLIASGPESITSWSDNGTTVNKRPEMTVAEWLEEIQYSLYLTDPETYGDRIQPDMSVAAFKNRFD
jgi:hypothetical protein